MTSDSLQVFCKGEKTRQSNKQRQVVGEDCSEEVVIQGNNMCKGPMCSAPWSSIEDAGVASTR